MNDYRMKERPRNQTLLVVEGNHEKNELFRLLFQCFPQIGISMENVWIYGTNIYMLYSDIEREYGEGWTEQGVVIDIPFVVSKKIKMKDLRYREDFTNIIIVFDYERHDPNFSEAKILAMKKCFTDSTDMGILYINYPMIESYQHLKSLPDDDYKELKIPVSLQPGSKYKALVRQDSIIEKIVNFPHKIDDYLKEELNIENFILRENCCERILNASAEADIDDLFREMIENGIDPDVLMTARYRMKDWIKKFGYLGQGYNYWTYMKKIFIQIIWHNVCKASYIENHHFPGEADTYRNCFNELDTTEILKIQNFVSRDPENGFIWILNTSVFCVPDYNFSLCE